MKGILISGITGFVGSHLKSYLESRGYRVAGLSRSPDGRNVYQWDPQSGSISPDAFNGIDAVINLAGANIADSRWTTKRKQVLRDSRISSTRTIVEGMAKCNQPPALFISMSGVNYYPRGDTPKTEASEAGESFLSKLCLDWETEALPAESKGVRTVILRLGVVLDKSGGALAKMLTPFRCGAGGPIGSGEQGFPWISLDDLSGIIEFAINQPSLTGPVNVVHPGHVTQGYFARELGRALNRPAIAKLPATMVRLLFGQMGDEMLLANLHVRPQKLMDAGYGFREENLRTCLNKMFAVN